MNDYATQTARADDGTTLFLFLWRAQNHSVGGHCRAQSARLRRLLFLYWGLGPVLVRGSRLHVRFVQPLYVVRRRQEEHSDTKKENRKKHKRSSRLTAPRSAICDGWVRNLTKIVRVTGITDTFVTKAGETAARSRTRHLLYEMSKFDAVFPPSFLFVWFFLVSPVNNLQTQSPRKKMLSFFAWLFFFCYFREKSMLKMVQLLSWTAFTSPYCSLIFFKKRWKSFTRRRRKC